MRRIDQVGAAVSPTAVENVSAKPEASSLAKGG